MAKTEKSYCLATACTRCRISESSTLCVSSHLPRASQPQHTSEMLAQCGSSRGCWQEGLQMACKEEESLLCTASQGFWFGTRQGIKTFYIHPAFCRGTSTTPTNSHTASFHYKQQSPFPVYLLEKEALKFCSKSTSEPGTKWWGLPWLPAPTPASLCPCPQPSWGTEKAHVPANISLAPSRAAGEGCFSLWILIFMSLG